MNSGTNICAVVVTFNRLTFLKECISGLLNQTCDLQKIIIVNNGSTDGTSEYLNSVKSDKIEIITQENCGGAGGFHTGIKSAYQQNFEWIWVMDDDVEPAKDCLEKLFLYKEISKCIHPLRIFSDNGEVFKWEHYFNPETCMPILHHNVSLQHKEYCFVNTACFEGMLINRDIVEKIGFPKKEYFIAGDDTEYGVLANLHTNVLYTKTALMYRKRAEISYKLRPLQAYYEFRNLFLLRKNIKPYFPGNKEKFEKNLQKEFYKRVKSILKGKEYTWTEKRILINKIRSGIKDGRKLFSK